MPGFEMYPKRPEPDLEIDEYDDGDPYSCMAAPNIETKWDKYVKTVKACKDQPRDKLDALFSESNANVLAALFDLWLRNRTKNKGLSGWAASEAKRLGDDRLVGYDQRNPVKSNIPRRFR